MGRHLRQSFVLRALVATGLLAGFGSLGLPVDLVGSEKRGELYSSVGSPFDVVASLEPNLRRSKYFLLSESERREVWREHLTSFVADDAALSRTQVSVQRGVGVPLSESQKEFVRDVITRLDFLFDSNVSLETRRDFASALCADIKLRFSREQAQRIFNFVGVLPTDSVVSNLEGGGDPSEALPNEELEQLPAGEISSSSPLFASGTLKIIVSDGRVPSEVPQCKCNQGSFCNCDNCAPATCWIHHGDLGSCGCLWLFDCNGTCSGPVE